MKFRGICYQPFPPGYDPSTAENNTLFKGSDIADKAMKPLWGDIYKNSTGVYNNCRDDIGNLHYLGIDYFRLYDWNPEKSHIEFLDYCHKKRIGVFVPASNWFLLQGFGERKKYVRQLIESFSNHDKTDYHPAVAGIIFANEPIRNSISVHNLIEFTKDWVDIEAAQFGGYRKPMIGHPMDFTPYGDGLPCWGAWDEMLAALSRHNVRDLNDRLFLAPQSYDDKIALFVNWGGKGKGYVDLTWERYKRPMLFTEFGQQRLKPGYEKELDDKLNASVTYAYEHPDRLLGVCVFQFVDKVWKKRKETEGNWGIHSHSGETLFTVKYAAEDLKYNIDDVIGVTEMGVDKLHSEPAYMIVVNNFIGQDK